MSTDHGVQIDDDRGLRTNKLRGSADAFTCGHHPVVNQLSWCEDHFGRGLAEIGGASTLEDFGVCTVGLDLYGHPEFIIFGVPPGAPRLILFDRARQVLHDGSYFDVDIQPYAVRPPSPRPSQPGAGAAPCDGLRLTPGRDCRGGETCRNLQ